MAAPQDRPRYRPSGKIDAAPFMLLACGAIVVAIGVGFLVHLCVVLRFPGALLGPLFGGLAVTIAIAIAVRVGKCRNSWIAGLLGVVAGAVVLLAAFQFNMVAVRGNDRILRVDLLPSWIDDHVHNNEIWEPGGPGKPRPVTEADVIFRYGMLLHGLFAGCAVPAITGWLMGAKPFSETHNRWFKTWLTRLTRESGEAVVDALTGNNEEMLPHVIKPFISGKSKKPPTAFSQLTLEYLASEPDTPVYLSAVLVPTGKSETIWPKTLAKRWELTATEAMTFATAFTIPEALFGERREGTQLGDRAATEIAARVLVLPDQEAGLILSAGNRWFSTFMALSPLFMGLVVGAVAGGVAAIHADEVELPVLIGLGVLSGVSVIGGLVWMGMFADFLPTWHYHRVARRVVAERAESLVHPDDPAAEFVQVVPRKNWGRVMLENADDVGFLLLDENRGVILYEGDFERWIIPRESVISFNLEAFDIGASDPTAGAAFWLVVLKANVGGKVWEAPVAPRPFNLAKHTPITRRRRAEELHARICACLGMDGETG